MQAVKLCSLTILLTLASVADIRAAEMAEPRITDREAVLQSDIARLKKELEVANKIIAEQKSELDAIRKAVDTMPAAAGTTDSSAPVSRDAVAVDSETVSGAEEKSEAIVRHVQTSPDVPIAITRLSPQELALGGVEDISRLEFLVPGLRYGQTGHDVRLSMRGARTNSIGPEATGVVGVYEDGVYIPTSTERLDALVDVERIDVLREPQLTTFGHHAYAGAISIVTNKPAFDGFHGYAVAESGLPDKTRWQLAMNIPLSDTWAVRLAGVSESRSGWINNYVIESDADDLNDRKVQTLRASVLWQPRDNFNFLLWVRYQDENGTGSGPWGYQQIGAYIDGALEPGHQFAPEGFSPDYDAWNISRNFISAAEYEHLVSALELNWDMGFASLKWLSSFTLFHGRQSYDNDYSNLGENTSSAFAGWDNDQRNWSTELRLDSSGDGPFNWLIGLYLFDRETEWGWLEAHNGVLSQPAWDLAGTYRTDTSALFGQASYEIGDRFILSGGLRWNEDGKTLKSGDGDSWSDVLWKAALEYTINDRSMSYISASTGYLAGGVNSAPGVNPAWEPEKLMAYEIGYKSLLANGRVRLNLAAWYNDFKDVQSQSFLVLPFPGSPEATEYTANGGVLNATGLEAEIQWLLFQQWNISSHITYTDATFGNYQTANLEGLGSIPGHTDGDRLSYKGWRPALSPKWVVGVQTSYDFQMKKWGVLTPYFQTTYASAYFANDINLAGIRQDSHSRSDLRLIWQTPVENFRFQVYYLNIGHGQTLNWARVYNPAIRPEITTLQANWSNPQTYGFIFDYIF